MKNKTEERVVELMKEHGLNTNDEMLKINIVIIYLEAQKDQIKGDKENTK